MTTQLSLYNGALRLCKERKLASLTENREPRRLLDDVWGAGPTGQGAVKACLQMGQWTFAMRSVQADTSPSVEPTFGYRYAFNQPTDMVKVAGVCQDPYYKTPLLEYVDERGYWYANQSPIYVRYVSNDASYGGDLSLWPETFIKVVHAYMAREIIGNLQQGDNGFLEMSKVFEKYLSEAKSADAMNTPTRFMPEGSWSAARGGRSGMRGSGWDGSWSS